MLNASFLPHEKTSSTAGLCVCVCVFELHVPVVCSKFTNLLLSANISLHVRVVPLTNHTFAEWLP